MKSTEILRVRCSADLRAAIDDYCEAHGCQLSDVVRAGTAKQLERPLPDPLPELAQVPPRGRPVESK